MASLIFQKLFVLVTGAPADTSLATALETQVSHDGWGTLIADVNGYLNAQAQIHGGANLIQQMALNGLGLELSDEDAAAIYAGVSSGATTWADLLAYVIVELEGPLGETLSNRAEAAGAFTDALVAQMKGSLYEWNGGPNLNNAAHNLLQSIGADETSFEMGMASLVELVNNLSAEGLGGVVSDGRLSGATVFIDANGNGLLDDGEEVDTTDAAGEYDVPADAPAGSLMMTGGTDILAVNAFIGVLQAPAGATVVTPLTSLAEALLDIGEEANPLDASATTTSALGLPPFNVLNYDPIRVLADPESTEEELAEALAIERVSIQLMNLASHLTVALMGEGMDEGEAAQAAWAAIAQAAANGTLDLTDADAIEELFEDAGVGDERGDIAEVVAALNEAADDADNIVDLAKVAVVAADSADELQDALDEGDGLDDWVDGNTGENLGDAIEEADPGFLLPGIPVDGEGSPNLPPTGSNGTVAVDEDTAYTFDADDFGYSDANGDEMAAVRIDTLPGAGTLMLDGEAVMAGQLVDAADLGLLTFTPAENGNGAAYASFTFSVQDDEGAFDSDPRTLTIDVTPVNDEPTGDVSIVGMTLIGNKIFAQDALADVEGIVGDVRFEWFANGESLGKFGSSLTLTEREEGKMITAQASYTDGGGTLELVMSAPVGPVGTPNNEPVGNVTISGDPTQNETLTASHDVTDEDGMGDISWQWFADGVEIDGATGEDYVLTQDEVGKDITVELRFTDLEGNDEAVPSDEVGPVINVNDAPTLTAVVDATTDEDAPFYFTYEGLLGASDAEDIDGDAIAFRVEWVGEDGTLEMWDGDSWEAVQAGDFIGGEDELRWTPDANLNGEDFDAFSIEAHDGELYSGSDVMVQIDVTPVNDAPTLTDVNVFKSTDEDTSVEITYAELALAADDGDIEGDPISFMVMDPGAGTLEEWTGEDWVAATVDTVLSAGEKLRWTPPANVNGSDVDAFTIRAFDGELLSSTDVLVEVEVYAVNDAPTLTSVSAAAGTEDTGVGFTLASVLAASDATDIDGDSVAIRIEAISSGTLWETSGEDRIVSAGEYMDSGETFVWIPPANANGNGVDAFTIVAWDGSLASSPAVQVEVNLAAVNDEPTLSTMSAFSGTEDTDVTFTLAGLAANGNQADVDGDSLQFRVESISSGTLYKVLAGEDTIVTSGEIIDSSETFRWRPAGHVNGNGVDAFTVVAWDGTAASSTPVQVEVNLASVNDAPGGTNGTVAALLNTAYDFTAADFGFSDPIDGNTLAGVRITTLPLQGQLLLNGSPVSAGQVIAVADIDDSDFTFMPDTGELGDSYASFTFQVQDNGGTSNGGVDLDPSANTLTINVTAPPTDITITSSSVTENVASGSTVGTLGAVDADDSSFTFELVSGTGSGDNGFFSVTGNSLIIEHSPNFEDQASYAIRVRVTDGDGNAYEEAMTISVTDVNEGSGGSTSSGADSVIGSSGNDTISAGNGNDTIYGGSGNDSITGGNGSDSLFGESGDDVLTAGNDGDAVYGGSGNDSILGGQGDDLIRGGSGNDTIDGDQGADHIYFERPAAVNGVDTVNNFDPENSGIVDRIFLPSAFSGIEADGNGFSGTIAAFDSSATADTNLAGKIALYTTAATTAADIAALFAGDDFSMSANGEAYILTGPASGATDDHILRLWFVDNNGTAAIATSEVTLIATITLQSASDHLGLFAAGNFGSY